MHFKTFRDYEVTVKIRNDFIIVKSKEFDLTYSAGNLSSFSIDAIGSAVIRCFHGITLEIAKGVMGKKVDKLLTIGQAAAILQISRSTLRRVISKNKIESVWTEGGHRRIRSSSLEKLIK